MSARFAAVVLALLAAREIAACSAWPWDPDALLENETTFSANGRYAAVARRHEGIPDFKKVRAAELLATNSELVTVAWYSVGVGRRTLFREIPLDRFSFHDVLLPDSGRFLVAVKHLRYGCYGRAKESDPLVTIYGVDGALVARVKAGELFERFDLEHQEIDSTFTLRTESNGREVVVISVPGKDVERRVDVETGMLLDEKRPIFPKPRVFVTPADVEWGVDRPADCEAWQSTDNSAVGSVPLLEAAVHIPMPSFPDVAFKARIRGVVQVHVLVSESGEVLCAASTPLPFGITQAATAAARQWRFRPFTRDGHAVRATGEVNMHFQDVSDEVWSEAQKWVRGAANATGEGHLHFEVVP